eukprot:7591580-Pyramimonas_sp.AAC.1
MLSGSSPWQRRPSSSVEARCQCREISHALIAVLKVTTVGLSEAALTAFEEDTAAFTYTF